MMFYGVLGGNDQERLRKRVGVDIDRDLPFVHSFQKSGLRFWSRAVDFIRKKNVGKYRASLEFERLFGRGVDGNPQQVARQHVAGELNTLKTALQGTRDC